MKKNYCLLKVPLMYCPTVFFAGTTAEREQEIIAQLNHEFMDFLAEGKTMKEAYSLMVNNYPYRILCNATYDWEEVPLDQVRV